MTSGLQYSSGWRWEDATWKTRAGNDQRALILEALRRAVDIRDRNAEGVTLRLRPVMLVDVLNALAASAGADTSALWEV